ncbi:MAG: T9SS type A sorting domain-containing protein [bacterium]|nr:T9SS type A sorting domain-containing protein [bacterium]
MDGTNDPENVSTVLFIPFEGSLASSEIPPATNSLSISPYPFNPRTEISFTISIAQSVKLEIYDMTGKRITQLVDRNFEPGTHRIDWQGKDQNGSAVASGSYLLRMITNSGVSSSKMMLVR